VNVEAMAHWGLSRQKQTKRQTNQVPKDARSKAWVCDHSIAGIAGFESRQGHGILFHVSVLCCHVEVSASGSSLFQRNFTDFCVSECDHDFSTIRRPWPTGGGGLLRHGKKQKKAGTCTLSKAVFISTHNLSH